MIQISCECGWQWTLAEAAPIKRTMCPTCGATLSIACAEELPEGGGAGDFDSSLKILSGHEHAGERIFLGGVAEITFGKADDRTIRLAEGQVSRHHCHLKRLDFGPSRWELIDEDSTNGVRVNGVRVTMKRLEEGDVIRVGGCELRFSNTPTAAAAGAPAGPLSYHSRSDGPRCPSCAQSLASTAKICLECGIYSETGRPILIAQGRDEDDIAIRAEAGIIVTSMVLWVTPLPIPLSSEAFGRSKPYATWGIAIATVLASVIFYIATRGETTQSFSGSQLMLWPEGSGRNTTHLTADEADEILAEMDARELALLKRRMDEMRGQVSESQLERRALESIINDMKDMIQGRPGHFELYQLVTHAFLHDNSSLIALILHLGGNMLFLLVFGARVNALLGNVAMLILYPLLATGAAMAHLLLSDTRAPMLGASGAIMGLAGMYLILFPAHRVYCAMWLRVFVEVFFKVFTLRGFWMLGCYFLYDILMIYLASRRAGDAHGGGVAHWAHTGGAIIGITIALGMLMSRMINCGGGDLFSVTLGKYAWGFIGKPSQWAKKALPAKVVA